MSLNVFASPPPKSNEKQNIIFLSFRGAFWATLSLVLVATLSSAWSLLSGPWEKWRDQIEVAMQGKHLNPPIIPSSQPQLFYICIFGMYCGVQDSLLRHHYWQCLAKTLVLEIKPRSPLFKACDWPIELYHSSQNYWYWFLGVLIRTISWVCFTLSVKVALQIVYAFVKRTS